MKNVRIADCIPSDDEVLALILEDEAAVARSAPRIRWTERDEVVPAKEPKVPDWSQPGVRFVNPTPVLMRRCRRWAQR